MAFSQPSDRRLIHAIDLAMNSYTGTPLYVALNMVEPVAAGTLPAVEDFGTPRTISPYTSSDRLNIGTSGWRLWTGSQISPRAMPNLRYECLLGTL